MTTSIVVLDLIKSSMRLFGGNGAGITPSSEEANDALLVMNDIISAWNTDGLMMYGKISTPVMTIPGVGQYTIGIPGGQFLIDRPADILGAYCTLEGADFDIDVIGQPAYDLLSLKTQPGDIIERLCYVNDFPLGGVLIWPVPTKAIQLTLQVNRVITQITDINTVLIMPPGYLKALRQITGIELAAEYGAEVDADIKSSYIKAKSDLMRLNRPKLTMRVDPILCGGDPASPHRG
jgi:hypothetical protein